MKRDRGPKGGWHEQQMIADKPLTTRRRGQKERKGCGERPRGKAGIRQRPNQLRGVYCVHPSKHGRWMSAKVRRLSSQGSHPCWHQPPREPTIGITWVIRQSVWQWRVVSGGRSPGCWQYHNQLFRVTGDYNVIGDCRPLSLMALFVKLLLTRKIKFKLFLCHTGTARG